ncbi:MAG: tetratricopeptide repeat protein [Gemmataceae bacterium]
MILRGAEFIQFFSGRSYWSRLRILSLAVLGVVVTVAAANLWAWHHYREANRLVDRYLFAKAYAEYTECLKVWRWSASTHLLAARTARRGALYSDAARHLTEFGRLQGSDSDTPVALALERLLLRAQSGDISEVEEVLWQFVKKDTPETPLILEAMAHGYLRMLRLGTALRCLRLLLEREPDNIEALVMRGWIQEGGGDPDEAGKDYRRALALNSERDDARQGLARVLIHDSPDKSCSLYSEVLARHPDNREALEGLAEAYRALGEPMKARPIFEALLSKDPCDSKALTGLGNLALAAGNAAEGESLLRRAIAADPGNADAHYQLYLCLIQEPGREAESAAERDTHKRIETDRARLAEIAAKKMTRTPNDPDLHSELGNIYLRNGKPEIGLRWLYSALKLDPAHQPSHQALFDYFKQTGELERAEQHRRQLHASAANPPPARP